MSHQPPDDTSTLVVWLLGHPVSHSLSPRIHNAAFRSQHLKMEYVARDVLPESLAEAVDELRSAQVCGANVTVPHKEAVVALLDEVVPRAEQVGAVNTIVNHRGLLRGHNTDVEGFIRALRTVMPTGSHGATCLVLGAGGAARAIVTALAQEGAAEVIVANRTVQRAVDLCSSVAAAGYTYCSALDLHLAGKRADQADLIVNATSVGLLHSVKELPIDVDTLRSGQVLMDLVYGSKPTMLVEAARAKGIVAIDGKELLVQQAALSYRLWTGREPPLAIMRESIDSLEK